MTKEMDTQRGTHRTKKSTTVQNRDLNAAQRVTMALQLRASKMTYEAIAQQCGYSNASACRKAILRELNRCVVQQVQTLRLEEAESLERLEAECWKIFYDKDKEKARLFAVDRIMQIKERRARLFNLDMKDDHNAMQIPTVRAMPSGYLGEQETQV